MGVKEIIEATCNTNSKDEIASDFVTLHAKCMYELMVLTKDAFKLTVSQPDQVVELDMLIRAVDHLRKLCTFYEQITSATNFKFCANQVIYVSREYFPELFCVSFKALQDVYSKSTSG